MKKAGKRVILTSVLGVFLSILLISLVLAANIDSTNAGVAAESIKTNADVLAQNIGSGVSKVYEGINLGPVNFTTILLGILLWMILYSIVDKLGLFKGSTLKGPGTALIALIITILALWGGLPTNVVDAILVQYQAMGATIITIIPFMIMIYFTTFVIDSLLLARAIWILYVIYYFGLYSAKIGSGAEGTTFAAANAPYWLAILFGIGMIITIGLIRAWAHKEEIKSGWEKMMFNLKKRKAVDDIKQKEFEFMNE